MEMTDIRKVSRFLSHHLDNIHGIGTEEIVNVKRLIKYCDRLSGEGSSKDYQCIVTGSRAEGFDFSSSDHDMMMINNEVIVVQPHDEIADTDVGKAILVMDATGCKPGYTLLRLKQVGRIPGEGFMDAWAEMNGSWYLSSVVFIKNMLPSGCYKHGPCATISCERTLSDDAGNIEVDIAFGFHCRSWPDHLSDFRYRTLDCAWPSRQLVNYIVRNGYHLVAIGDKHASLYAMQWRVSFAKAEKSLVMSFNHVQFKTYALLKMFLKECIERDQFITDMLCSYFMKTIVFHAIEHSKSSMWVDENIVQCFWFCFTILLEFVQTGYCPNYFVLTCNMFLSNVIGDNRRRLLHVLSRYQCMGWNCLFLCPNLLSLPQTIQESHSMYPLSHHEEATSAEINQDLRIFSQYTCIGNYNIAGVLKMAYSVLLKCSGDIYCDIALLYTINAIGNTSRNSIADITLTHPVNSNKVVYNQVRKKKHLLHVSSATDVCGGLLSLATFYYNVGCYSKTSDVATRVVVACQQSALMHLHGNFTEYYEEICGKGYTLLQKTKRTFVSTYVMQKMYNRLYPPELDIEVQTNDTFIDLPPLPYAVFLLVLSTYRLGNIDQSRTILDDLLAVRTNQIYGVRHYPIVHNLVGICHQLLGDTRQAIKAFEDSCRQLSDNPAAAIRIANLRQTQREEGDDTCVDALDYRNVPCRYQGCDSVYNSNDERLYYHKTMYNIDPVSFVDKLWF